MKSPRDKQFYEYKDGTPMPVEDLIEALRAAISMLGRVAKTDYARKKVEVLEKHKEALELAKAMSVKPKGITVKRRNK